MLALLLAPGPADAVAGGTTLEASLEFSSQQQGEIRLELAWPGGPYPPEGMDWAGLREQYLDTNFSLSGEPNAEAVLRYLTAPMPGGNDTASLTAAILGSDAVDSASVSALSAERGNLRLTIQFSLADNAMLHPLMFVSQLNNASALEAELVISYPPDVKLETSKFVLDHLRTPMGGWLGIDLLASDTASYDPAEGEITMSAAPQWADGRVIAIAVVLQLLLIVAISYRYGGSLLRPLLFGGAALLAYLFVSFPFSTGLCYTIILFGLARQYVGAIASEELRRDMDGFVDTLLTRPRGVAAASGSRAALEELRASRNPLARLFPFKVQEPGAVPDLRRRSPDFALDTARVADGRFGNRQLDADRHR